ncbi:hypothetical protein [Crassaminicella profunda]|uniref:hypothetical protein n=1 Tax=Crassaminicella profunda TaxID=1286698 RepID=UPI001CA6CC40|nr:hypothetical protein [Crassaminicella profunda]QZY53632.1 hypothetical protein K7H06_11215 [Crassaminicella profunda]
MNQIHYVMAKALINRYDYAGVIELLEKMENVDPMMMKLLYSCKYAMNFDFKSAYYEVSGIENIDSDKKLINLKKNLQELMDGRAHVIFSELIENTKMQIENRRYIDFLSRVYRLKEAILKYIFVKNHIDKSKFSFRTEAMSKRMILKVLRKKYKIHNPNLSFAISNYISKYLKDPRYHEALKILNTNKMNEIIELRHACIAGHGFIGVKRRDLVNIYGNPEAIIDDFCHVLERIGVNIRINKYDKINGYILELLKTM